MFSLAVAGRAMTGLTDTYSQMDQFRSVTGSQFTVVDDMLAGTLQRLRDMKYRSARGEMSKA